MQYLELMAAPANRQLSETAAKTVLTNGEEQALERLRPHLDAYVTVARQNLDHLDGEIARRLEVAAPVSGAQGPVTVRYLISALRTGPDELIFGTWAAAFALMKADPRVVGVNLVAPEDAPIARRGFDRHMQILDFLWKKFDRPNVTLHAGELNLTLNPVEDMTSHIRKSIEIGHAKRIGHGTAVAWEDDVPGLLRMMRERRIAVEVCPTSAAVILGMAGDRHPFRLYRRAGVPLTINTDDEGVSRSNLTMEYVRAIQAWGLSYRDLKELARNSIEYSFLPGESLFADHDYKKVRSQFRSLRRRGWQPTDTDQSALAASDKARVQARLERAFLEFEK
jgi:adenosine deaminase